MKPPSERSTITRIALNLPLLVSGHHLLHVRETGAAQLVELLQGFVGFCLDK